MKGKFSLRSICLSLLFPLTLWSCMGDSESSSTSTDSIANTADAVVDAPKVSSVTWKYDAEADSMVQLAVPDSLSIDQVLADLNKQYQSMQLDLVKTSGDTVFVKMNDVTLLSQMGSSGNYGVLAEIVYSLTEVRPFQFVHLDFEELDHATPGLYDRERFNNKL